MAPPRGALVLFVWNDIHGRRRSLAPETWSQPIQVNINWKCRDLVEEITRTLRKHWKDRAGHQALLLLGKTPDPKVKSVDIEWFGQEEDTMVYFRKDTGKDATSLRQWTDDLDMETIWEAMRRRDSRFYVRYNLEEETD
jgi:hypothetical protein